MGSVSVHVSRRQGAQHLTWGKAIGSLIRAALLSFKLWLFWYPGQCLTGIPVFFSGQLGDNWNWIRWLKECRIRQGFVTQVMACGAELVVQWCSFSHSLHIGRLKWWWCRKGPGERMPNSLLFWSPNNLCFCLSLGEQFRYRVSWEARIKCISANCFGVVHNFGVVVTLVTAQRKANTLRVRQSATKCQWLNCCWPCIPQTLHQSSQLQWDRACLASI